VQFFRAIDDIPPVPSEAAFADYLVRLNATYPPGPFNEDGDRLPMASPTCAQNWFLCRDSPACDLERPPATQRMILHKIKGPSSTPRTVNGRASGPDCVRTLLVAGNQGAGTHFTSGVFNAMLKPLRSAHEQAILTDVAVSWPKRCPIDGDMQLPSLSQLQASDRRNTPVLMRPEWLASVDANMAQWSLTQLQPKCSYRRVLHLVRHPLTYLGSNRATGFLDCIECWGMIERNAIPPIHDLTEATRKLLLFNRNRKNAGLGSVRNCSGKERGMPVPGAAGGSKGPKGPAGGTKGPNATMLAIRDDEYIQMETRATLQSLMLAYIVWNRNIEATADWRIRIEQGVSGLRSICAKLVLSGANAPGATATFVKKWHDNSTALEACNETHIPEVGRASHGGSKHPTTWQQLEEASPVLAAEVWATAQRYGYERAPPDQGHGKDENATAKRKAEAREATARRGAVETGAAAAATRRGHAHERTDIETTNNISRGLVRAAAVEDTAAPSAQLPTEECAQTTAALAQRAAVGTAASAKLHEHFGERAPERLWKALRTNGREVIAKRLQHYGLPVADADSLIDEFYLCPASRRSTCCINATRTLDRD
jgi:hypothetical protein